MKKASPVPTDNAEVKKTTELVNSYEDILSKVKPAPSAAASQEATSEPTSDEDAQAQNTEKARAVLDEDTIRAIENIAVDSAASEFAVQASEYALAGWHYEGSSTVGGTPPEASFEANHPEIKLQKYDQYSDAYQALEDGRGDAFSTDNTEVIAWAIQHPGFSVGIKSLGDTSYIAAAVKKGNTALLDWLNNELVELGEENFFHKDYEQTLAPVYGDAATPDDLVVEGGQDTTSSN